MSTRFKLKTVCISALIIYLSYLALEELDKKSRHDTYKYFGNNTLLVIAHPDDETMFFGPTIMNIIKINKYITILCLSGDKQRKEELKSAANLLSPQIQIHFSKLNTFTDVQNKGWDRHKVKLEIQHVIKSYNQDGESTGSFDSLITFDEHGISSHEHHKSLFKAVAEKPNELFWPKSMKILTLKTVSLFRKYLSLIEANYYCLISYLNLKTSSSTKKFSLVINLDRYQVVRKALMLHRSQMVWFRLLYLNFSRYMFINDLELLS